MRARQQILLVLSIYLSTFWPSYLPATHVPIHLATSPSNLLIHLSTHPISTSPSIYFIHQFISVIHPMGPSINLFLYLPSTPSIQSITNHQSINPPTHTNLLSLSRLILYMYTSSFLSTCFLSVVQQQQKNVIKAHCGLLHVIPSEAIKLIESIWPTWSMWILMDLLLSLAISSVKGGAPWAVESTSLGKFQ